MAIAKKVPVLIFFGLLLLIGGFLGYFYHNFKLDQNFTPIPLSFDPYTSTSTYNWHETTVSIHGGFVKGQIKASNQQDNLLLRSLSPNPTITVKNNGNKSRTIFLQLENVNPTKTIVQNSSAPVKILDFHTLQLSVKLQAGENKSVSFTPKDTKDYLEFVILGDNRNGYKTFSQIIQQINAVNPVFVIDNGDLVFGGEPNRYRLFYQTVSKLQLPLYTTLGNHDIRKNGRVIYTELFGPPYYSFDYRNSHFVFLDSSRGWTEKTAIPPEQYSWLEADLQKAQGKRIYVISHIPSTDPRSDTLPNEFPDIPHVQKTDWFEREMNHYIMFKNLNHAFHDGREAAIFEGLMQKYNVNTVFLSHIHSYFSYLKGGVGYVISGGGGAELLTEDSYYHYIRVKATDRPDYLEVVELPSPPNDFQDRFVAAGQMFAVSIYKEYTTAVLTLGFVAVAILAWILWVTRHNWWPKLKFLARWLYAIAKFSIAKFRELRTK